MKSQTQTYNYELKLQGVSLEEIKFLSELFEYIKKKYLGANNNE